MVTARHTFILVLFITLALVGAAHTETLYTASPAVAATAMPYGGTVVTDEAQTPVSPLLVEATSVSGGNSGWAQAAPGRLRATSAVVNAPESWLNSQGVAVFVDNFRLDNPAMPANSSGVFFFRFHLTGTLRIAASDPMSSAMVNVAGSTILGGSRAGQLNFGRIDGVPTLYAVSGGSGNPVDNLLADPGGARRIYGTTTTQTDGSYEIQVAVPVAFIFTNMPINTDPPADDWKNQVEVRLSAVSFSNAACDFSSTFEFAPQNPILPDPEAGLPAIGWTLGTASDEIALPSELKVATATGSGEAGFVAEQGTISGLAALTLDDFPAGLSGGDFAHGWFALDVALLDGQGTCDVAITLPTAVGTGAAWWFHDGALWQNVVLADDDGDGRVLLSVLDNGTADGDPAEGVISLAGGISPEVPLPAFLSLFQAVWRAGGVDLSWRAPDAAPGSLRLEARLDGGVRDIPLSTAPAGGFSARDEDASLFGGGTVRYDLSHEGRLLDSRTVALPPLAAARLGVISPNPFNPKVEVAYTVARDAGLIELSIHDLQGRRVVTLFAGEPGPGRHVAVWQGRDAAGKSVSSGIYVVRLTTEQAVEARKISLVR